MVPISGFLYDEINNPWILRHVPIWVFHGEKDKSVNVNRSIEPVNLLKKYSDKARITIYPDRGHDIWGLPFTKNKIITWMLDQNKTNNIPKPKPLDSDSYKLYIGKFTLNDNPKDTIEVIYKR